MAYIGREPQVGNFQVCDAISVVNGQAAYTMQVSSVNVSPETANHVLCSLNGVLQKPGSSFTVSGSTITFASNLVTGDVIDFIQILGSTLDLGVPSDSTVSLAKLTATGTKDATTFLRGDNTFASAGGANTPAFSAIKNANQDLSDAVTAKITFETEEFDTDSAFASSRFTVPSGKGGKYLITSSIFFTHTSANSLYTINNFIYKNGSVVKADNTYLNYGFTQHTMQVVALLDLSASDYIEIYGASNSNGNTPKVEQNTATFFSGFKLI